MLAFPRLKSIPDFQKQQIKYKKVFISRLSRSRSLGNRKAPLKSLLPTIIPCVITWLTGLKFLRQEKRVWNFFPASRLILPGRQISFVWQFTVPVRSGDVEWWNQNSEKKKKNMKKQQSHLPHGSSYVAGGRSTNVPPYLQLSSTLCPLGRERDVGAGNIYTWRVVSIDQSGCTQTTARAKIWDRRRKQRPLLAPLQNPHSHPTGRWVGVIRCIASATWACAFPLASPAKLINQLELIY